MATKTTSWRTAIRSHPITPGTSDPLPPPPGATLRRPDPEPSRLETTAETPRTVTQLEGSYPPPSSPPGGVGEMKRPLVEMAAHGPGSGPVRSWQGRRLDGVGGGVDGWSTIGGAVVGTAWSEW